MKVLAFAATSSRSGRNTLNRRNTVKPRPVESVAMVVMDALKPYERRHELLISVHKSQIKRVHALETSTISNH